MEPVKVAIIYYSATGTVHALARAAAEGAEKAGAHRPFRPGRYGLRDRLEHRPRQATAIRPGWYIEADRRVTGTTRATHNGHKAPASGVSNTEVRIWAKAHDLEVKDRGRIPADVLAQYGAATGK